MAGVGEASTIAGLFSLGIQVTAVLYSVADGIGAAGEEVRNVARDVDSATQIMRTIQGVLDKQPHVNDEIGGVVKRIMDICDQIFRIYDVLQKGLVPLLERFRDSEKKLEQFGLRLKWYFRSKEKVTGCRHALQQQIAMLTPILTLLTIDRSAAMHNNYYVQNIQVKYILENSTANLQYGVGNESRQRVSTRSSLSTLLPSGRDTSRDTPQSREASATGGDNETTVNSTQKSSTSTAETLNSQTALIRYHSPDKNNESFPQEEAEEVGQQVVEILDRNLDSIPSSNIEFVTIETYSVEIQFSRLVRQILVDLENKNTRTSSEDGGSSLASDLKPQPTVPAREEKWTRINKPDGTSSVFPVDTIDTTNKFILALHDLGYNIFCLKYRWSSKTDAEWINKFMTDPDGVSLDYNALNLVLESNEIKVVDSDRSVIIPRLWERHSHQARTISLMSTKPKPEGDPRPKGVGFLRRLGMISRA